MGVPGLWHLLEPVRQPISLEKLAGKTVAIDMNIWLHQAVKSRANTEVGGSRQYLAIFFRRLCKLLFYGIRPVFVFDGDVPTLKKATMASRRELRNLLSNKAEKAQKRLLHRLLRRVAEASIKSPNKKYTKVSTSSTENLVKCELLRRLNQRPDVQQAKEDEELFSALPNNEEKMKSSTSNLLHEQAGLEYEELARDFLDSFNSSLNQSCELDLQSDAFCSLPLRAQLHVVRLAREQLDFRNHQSGLNKFADRKYMSEQAELFSDNQLKRLLLRRRLSEQLQNLSNRLTKQEAIRKIDELKNNYTNLINNFLQSDSSINSNSIISSALRIQSQDDGHAILIKQSPIKNVPDSCQSNVINLDSLIQQDTSKSDSSTDSINQSVEIIESSPSCTDDVENQDFVIATTTCNSNSPSISIKHEDYSSQYTIDESNPKISLNDESSSHLDFKESNIDVSFISDSFITSATASSDQSNNKDCSTNINAQNINIESVSSDLDECSSVMFNEQENKQTGEDKLIHTVLIRNSVDSMEQSDLKNKISVESLINKTDSETDDDDDNDDDDFIEVSNTHEKSLAMDNNELLGSTSNNSQNENELIEEKLQLLVDENNENNSQIKDDSDHYNNENDNQGDDDGDIDDNHNLEHHSDESVNNPDSINLNLNQTDNILFSEFEEDDFTLDDNFLRENADRLTRQAQTTTSRCISEAQDLLHLFGMPYICSPEEAEAQCTVLQRLGFVDLIASDDSDVWPFGARIVCRYLFGGDQSSQSQKVNKNGCKTERLPSLYSLNEVKNKLGLDLANIIRLTLLCGSDYTRGIDQVGPVTGVEILSEFNQSKDSLNYELEQWVLGKAEISDHLIDTILEPLKNFSDWWQTNRSESDNSKNPTESSPVRRRWLNLKPPPNFPDVRIARAYMCPNVKVNIDPFKWEIPNVQLLVKHANLVLGWNCDNTEAMLNSVLKNREKIILGSIDKSLITNYFPQLTSDESQKLAIKNEVDEVNLPSKRARKATSKLRKRILNPDTSYDIPLENNTSNKSSLNESEEIFELPKLNKSGKRKAFQKQSNKTIIKKSNTSNRQNSHKKSVKIKNTPIRRVVDHVNISEDEED